MRQERLNQLATIYNALMGVSTKGEDSFIMADCLRALQGIITLEQQELAVSKDTPESEKDQ